MNKENLQTKDVVMEAVKRFQTEEKKLLDLAPAFEEALWHWFNTKSGRVDEQEYVKEPAHFDAKIIVKNSEEIDRFVEQLKKIPEFQILTPEQKMRIASCYPIITETVIME